MTTTHCCSCYGRQTLTYSSLPSHHWPLPTMSLGISPKWSEATCKTCGRKSPTKHLQPPVEFWDQKFVLQRMWSLRREITSLRSQRPLNGAISAFPCKRKCRLRSHAQLLKLRKADPNSTDVIEDTVMTSVLRKCMNIQALMCAPLMRY